MSRRVGTWLRYHSAVLVMAALMLAALGVVVFVLAFRPGEVASDVAQKSARAWADELGIRVTGIVCDRARCTVAPEHGSPFVVYCDAASCRLPERSVQP